MMRSSIGASSGPSASGSGSGGGGGYQHHKGREDSDLETQVLELVECPICCDFLQEATETPCCHGLFCNPCLSGWAGGKATCPGCRARLEISRCTVNVPIQRFIDAMAVDCPFRVQGCNAKPSRSDLEKHKEMCSFRPEVIAEKTQQRLAELQKRKDDVQSVWNQKIGGGRKGVAGLSVAERKELGARLIELAKNLHAEAEFKEAAVFAERALAIVSAGGNGSSSSSSTVSSPASSSSNTGKGKQIFTSSASAGGRTPSSPSSSSAASTSTSSSSASVGSDPLALAECLALLALIQKESASYEQSLQNYTQAEAIATSAGAHEKVAEYLLAKGGILVRLAKFKEANEVYERALEISKSKLGVTSTVTAEILNAIGLVAKKCSDYGKAIQVYQDAMHQLDSDNPKWPEMANNLADVYRKKGNYAEARDLYLRSMAKIELTQGARHPQLAEVCNALGMLAKKEGSYDEAIKYYKKALKIAKHLFGKSHPSVGMYLTNLGDVYRKQGDYRKAEGLYFTAIATLEAALGRDHVEVAEPLNSMGLVLKKRADYDGAKAYYERAIDIVIKTFGEKHYKVGIYLNNLGDVERKKGRYPQALEIYNRALKAIEATLGHTHSEAADILHNIGLVQHQLGKYDAAIKLYVSALDIVKKEFGPQHYKVGMFLNSSGLARAMLGDYKLAYEEMKQALLILQQCLGLDHVEVADCYANLGDVCMKLQVEARSGTDKLDEARKYYTAANRIVEATLGAEHTKCKQFASLLFICENYASLSG